MPFKTFLPQKYRGRSPFIWLSKKNNLFGQFNTLKMQLILSGLQIWSELTESSNKTKRTCLKLLFLIFRGTRHRQGALFLPKHKRYCNRYSNFTRKPSCIYNYVEHVIPTTLCTLTLQASGLLHMTEAKIGLVMDPQAANVFTLKLHVSVSKTCCRTSHFCSSCIV